MRAALPACYRGHLPLPVLLAALAIIFDGLDNQLLGFAVPAIIRDWHVSRASFGPVIATGLVGMGVGSAFAGPIGDRLGRRTALIGTVLLFAAATTVTAFANSLLSLGMLRFLAGAGIGGAIPNASAISAEFTPLKRRAMAVSLTMICVPIGGMIGGTVAAHILPARGWRALFLTGGLAPIPLCILLWFLMPESPGFLAGRPQFERTALSEIFAPKRMRDTLSLWLTFFCCLLSVYMAFSWLPTLLTSEGFSLAGASYGLALYNVGGVAGALVCGALIARFGSRIPMLAAAFGASASVLMLNAVHIDANGPHTALLAGFTANGFFVNAVQVACFALAAHVYPASVRASGIAFALTAGRLGPLLSAFVGAALIQAGRTAFLSFLALSMAGAFIGLALVRNHIPSVRS